MIDIKPFVQIESPFANNDPELARRNVLYGRLALRDSLLRGEAPFASHLLYAQDHVLDDTNPEERRLGMEAGFLWLHVADYVAVYTDLGISPGMAEGIKTATSLDIDIDYRTLDSWNTVTANQSPIPNTLE